MPKETLVVDSNVFFLKQGISLLEEITNDQYSQNSGPYNKSGVGKHFRHIIEHYFSFLNPVGRLIDYDARERDLRLETDRSFMIEAMESVITGLNKLNDTPSVLDTPFEIRSNEGIGEENSPLSSSSLRRELQFLISHTVHHYALIGLILQTLGIQPAPDFGVAPSTLRYEKESGEGAQAS
jgi:uncharacterized damage-inducible protein DinB